MALLALGVPILIASLNVVQYTVPYAFEGPFAGIDKQQRQELLWASGDAGVQHSVSVTIDKHMKPPVRVRAGPLPAGSPLPDCAPSSWGFCWLAGSAPLLHAQCTSRPVSTSRPVTAVPTPICHPPAHTHAPTTGHPPPFS